MPSRHQDWFKQAEHDLDQANDSLNNKKYDWCCFAATQAAKKAVKALHLKNNQEAWGHAVNKLLAELPKTIKVENELIQIAKSLDHYYIPTRYPNGHAEGAPFENYTEKDAKDALEYAGKIITFIKNCLAN